MIYFSTTGDARLSRKQLEHINGIFNIANSVISLFYEIEAARGTTFMLSLARFMVSELDLLRHGFKSLSQRKFDFLKHGHNSSSDILLRRFDGHFGQVRDHRNILQHYGDYIFGEQEPAKVERAELERVGIPITVEPGGSIGRISSCLFGPWFCSSNRSGKIKEVYVGEHTPSRIQDTLSLLCSELSASGRFRVEVVPNLDFQEYRKHVELMQTHHLSKP